MTLAGIKLRFLLKINLLVIIGFLVTGCAKFFGVEVGQLDAPC